MIVYLSCSPAGLVVKSQELAPYRCEQLLTPATNNTIAPGMFAVDNSCFAHFDRAGFGRLLEKVRPHAGRCRWVSAPDVVGNAKRTLEAFEYWHPRIRSYGLKVALVLQNGIESERIPWQRVVGGRETDIACVFIGGDDKFKGSQAVKDAVKAAKLMGVWVHMGRVNNAARRDLAESLECDSSDGTGLVIYPDMRAKFGDDPNELFHGNGVQERQDGPVLGADAGRGNPPDAERVAASEPGDEGTTGGVTDAA